MFSNSTSIFLFLPVIYVTFCAMPDRWRWLMLLVVSYWFYSTLHAQYLLVAMLIITSISYVCGLRIAECTADSTRKRWLLSGASACLIILVIIKYLPSLGMNTRSLLWFNDVPVITIISIGVSYYSFQAISYMADIYLEIQDPEEHFGYYALYLAFFPKLLQGPIERAGDLLPQLRKPYQFEYDTVRSGMLLFMIGLFKKIVVADRCSLYADQLFNHVHDYSGVPVILGTYAFAFQIYYDFSGYTDMARGVGRMFGVTLTENFNNPYLATSIADFWRRWHISFSRWILDYIFKPLQMSWRTLGQGGTAVALIITFFISGLWHGATKGFLVWGVCHGVFLALSTYYRPYQKRLYMWLGVSQSRWLTWWKVFVTFNLVSLAWIFFRSNCLRDGFYLVKNVFRVDKIMVHPQNLWEGFSKNESEHPVN